MAGSQQLKSGAKPSLQLRTSQGLSLLAGVLILVMAILGSLNLALRLVTSKEIPFAVEALTVLLPTAVYVALPQAQAEGANVRSLLLLNRMRGRTRQFAEAFGMVLALATASVMGLAAAQKAWESTNAREMAVGITEFPVYPVRIAIAAGLLLMCIVCFRQLGVTLRAWRSGQQAASEPGVEVSL